MLKPVSRSMIESLHSLMSPAEDRPMTPEGLYAAVCDAVTPDCDVQVDWSLRHSADTRRNCCTRSVDVIVVSERLERLAVSGETCEAAWAEFCSQWEPLAAQESLHRIDAEVA